MNSMKGLDMKKISTVIILAFVMMLLLAGCVKSPSVPMKDESNVKSAVVTPPVKEPTIVPPTSSEPAVVKPPGSPPRIPDSHVWEHLGKTRSGDTYFAKKIVTASSGIIAVSTYKIVTDDFRKQTIEEVKNDNLKKSIKYQNYEHDVRIDEIDCKNNRYRVKEVTHYDEKGNVLDSYQYKNEEWKNIPVLTGLDALREKFCIPQKKPSKRKK